MKLQCGDLVKFRLGGEPRFGTFERYGRDARCLISIPGESPKARVELCDIIENRSEDERQFQANNR